MEATKLKMLRVVLLALTLAQMCAANDLTASVFAVTSKTETVRWSSVLEVSSFTVVATSIHYPSQVSVFYFGGNTGMGTINSLTPDTPYSITVEAKDDSNNTIASTNVIHTTAPEFPTIVEAYSKQSNSITVEFTAETGATGYIVRVEREGFFEETPVSGSPGTAFGLEPFTDYTVSVLSVNEGGRSQPSYPVDVKTVISNPVLETHSPANSTIVVTWPPVANASLYSISIIQAETLYRLDVNTTDTTVTFESLHPGTTYCIEAHAWDLDGRPGDEGNKCQITRPASPDSVFVITSPPGVRTTEAVVVWEAVRGAVTYLVVASGEVSCNSIEITNCDLGMISCGDSKFITVTAQNEAGSSEPSDVSRVIIPPCPTEKIWVDEDTRGDCVLRWLETESTLFYTIEIEEDDHMMHDQLNTTENSLDFTCDCGKVYTTFVYTHNSAGTTKTSPFNSYTTIPCCPGNVSIELDSTETLVITWSPAPGAHLYVTTADMIQCNDTKPTCALSGLECDTEYDVKVTPCSDVSGCNPHCGSQTHKTAPCAPDILMITSMGGDLYDVYVPTFESAEVTVTASSTENTTECQTTSGMCTLQLTCGQTYKVLAVSNSDAGRSLPGFSKTQETAPCCPDDIKVNQTTPATSMVEWGKSIGARTFITTLTSAHGHARCHTEDNHCLMGCIICSTNYNVTVEAISSTGLTTECTYQGFSSSPCCPVGVTLNQGPNRNMTLHWKSRMSRPQSHIVEVSGNEIDITEDVQGDTQFDFAGGCGVYTVKVSPVGPDHVKVLYCPSRELPVCATRIDSPVYDFDGPRYGRKRRSSN